MADGLFSAGRITGPQLSEYLDQEWPRMERTRRRAVVTDRVMENDDPFVMIESVAAALGSAADQYVAQLPHPTTVPQRILQKVIDSRPHLSVPLGPKGLGLTAQRLTTKVEQPLNAICEDPKVGFQWEDAAAAVLFHGWAASVTVTDPTDWQKHASAWDDSEARALKEQADREADPERQAAAYGEVERAYKRAGRKSDLALDVFRARNVPLRNRIVTIHQAAPVFGPDLGVEGLLISQEFSTSYLRRHYEFGDAGVATPTGGNGQDESGRTATGARTLTLIEGWLYDEDGVPYYTCCVKGAQAVETRWKSGDNKGDVCVIDLKDRFGLDRLPVAWGWGLGNPAQRDPDRRSYGVLEPFIQGWRSVRSKMTANNVSVALFGYPVLLTERALGTPALDDGDGGDDDGTPDILPMAITDLAPGRTLKQLDVRTIDDATFKQIQLELGAVSDEAPGRSNGEQSGFSQSMAEAFEQQSVTTVHDTLGRLYEAHGSFVLEAGKRLPELGKQRGGQTYAPIMVFRSTDVPVNEGDTPHNEPMELDPDLIDETFTCVARYTASLSIPEKQQAMEEVARNLRTRRKYLEDTGDESPETTELELIVEHQRGTPEYQQYIMGLVAKIQGAEEVAEMRKAQNEGLMNDKGLPTALASGVAPAMPGEMAPLQPGAPGVPMGGSTTGMAPPSYGQSALAGAVGGGTMQGPINGAVQAGGVVPANLPVPSSVG